MKRYLTLLLLCLACACIGAQESTQNYLQTVTMLDANGDKRMEQIRYYDRLGRQFQEVLRNYPFAQADSSLITMQGYDNVGRLNLQCLPVTAKTDYLEPIDFLAESASRYGSLRAGEGTVTTYEASALDRITKITPPGRDWQNHPRTFAYASNAASGNLSCALYTVNASGGLVRNGNYTAGRLLVEQSADEDGQTGYTFTDLQGRTVLSRTLDGSMLHDTYYIYDDHGNLCYVLPPMINGNITTANLDKYAYRYKYDHRNRCIEKKLPGVEPVTYMYDYANQLTFSQDGNQRGDSLYTAYLYDQHGRMVMQGEVPREGYVNVNNQMIICIPVAQAPNLIRYRELPGTGYASNLYAMILYTSALSKYHVINYYDNYNFRGTAGFPTGTYTAGNTNGKGMLTGSAVAVLGSNSKLHTAYYYDIKGQVVKSISNNLLGGYETTNTTYTFTGKPATMTQVHTATGKTTQTRVYTYTYDQMDRLKAVTHKLNSEPAVTLANNVYDALGRLKSNSRKGNSNLRTNYTYNIRNWTKSVSSPLFTETLWYNDQRTSGTLNEPRYNGNISGADYTTNLMGSHKYSYTYDGLSRLTGATTDGWANHSTAYSYDKHGNITSLQRSGYTGSSTYGVIDNLTMTYAGNQLTRVDDAVANRSVLEMEFKNVASASSVIEYEYDGNGNLTKDLNKNIVDIEYNILNLPNRIEFGDNSYIEYTYAADGTKSRTKHVINGVTTTTDYCGNVIYENGALKRILTEGGYIANGVYHFYLQDHLGNNRVVANANGAIVQSNHYYPYGMSFTEGNQSSSQPYKFGGKELDTQKGLNMYDFEARMQDPVLGIFQTPDPLTEKYYSWSPYVYCMSNPTNRIDPTGMASRYNWDLGRYEDDEGNEVSWEDVRNEHNIGKNEPSSTDYVNLFVGFFLNLIGLHPDQRNSENPAVREDAKQRTENFIEGGHAFNETMASFVPGGDIAYNLLIDREISADGYAWAAVGFIPLGKIATTGGRFVTRFISTADGIVDLGPTLNRIAAGGKFPHKNDGTIFKNLPPKGQSNPLLPIQSIGYYQEYVVPTPGVKGPGAMRIVMGKNGQMWFTSDHYKTFVPIK